MALENGGGGSSLDKTNPFRASTGSFRFDLFEPEHVRPAVSALIERGNAAVDSLALAGGTVAGETVAGEAGQPSSAGWEEIIGPFESICDEMTRVWGTTAHLMSVANSAELREVYAEFQPQLVDLSLRLSQSRPFFDAIEKMASSPDQRPPRDRILQGLLDNARLAGVALEGDAKERFAAVQQELAQLGTKFSNNLLDATTEFFLDVDDPAVAAPLPTQLKAMAAEAWASAQDASSQEVVASPEQGPWRFTLDAPSLIPFLEHCRDRGLREHMYRAQVTKASAGEHDNSELVERILALRRESASLLGYATHAEVSLVTKMARDVAEVRGLLGNLLDASSKAASTEHADLVEFARSHELADEDLRQGGDLALWDVAFWSERLREERYGLRDDELRPYFPFPRVLEGLFALVTKLFNVSVVEADGEVEVWHPDVRFFRVFDGDGGTELASFYLDAYSRPGAKRGGAWMNSAIGRSQRLAAEGSNVRLPVAYLVCNQVPPSAGTPSLMSFGEVRTLFHEFGHSLQHMLTTVDESLAAGIEGVEWDAVEIASQFMENWCYDEATIQSCSGHVETGDPLPASLLGKLQAARTFRSGTAMLRQISFAFIDLTLHHDYCADGEKTAFDVQREISASVAVLPPLAEDRFLCGFSHIFAGGYAAGYYSYKWAEIMSADVFAAFEEEGLADDAVVARVGQRYRETFLDLGGSVGPAEVFRRFRGRGPDAQALLRHSGLDSGLTG